MNMDLLSAQNVTEHGKLLSSLGKEDVPIVVNDLHLIAKRYLTEWLMPAIVEDNESALLKNAYSFISETFYALKIKYCITIEDFCIKEKRMAFDWIAENAKYPAGNVKEELYNNLTQFHVGLGTLVALRPTKNGIGSTQKLVHAYNEFVQIWLEVVSPLCNNFAKRSALREPIGRISYGIFISICTIYQRHAQQFPYIGDTLMNLVTPVCLNLCYSYLQAPVLGELLFYFERFTSLFCQHEFSKLGQIVECWLQFCFSPEATQLMYDYFYTTLKRLKAGSDGADKQLAHILVNDKLLAIYEETFNVVVDDPISKTFLQYLLEIVSNLDDVSCFSEFFLRTIMKNYWERDLATLSSHVIKLCLHILTRQKGENEAVLLFILQTLSCLRYPNLINSEHLEETGQTQVEELNVGGNDDLFEFQVNCLIVEYDYMGHFRPYIDIIARRDAGLNTRLVAIEILCAVIAVLKRELATSESVRTEFSMLVNTLPDLIDSMNENEGPLQYYLVVTFQQIDIGQFIRHVPNARNILSKAEDYFIGSFSKTMNYCDITVCKALDTLTNLIAATGATNKLVELSLTLTKQFKNAKKKFFKLYTRNKNIDGRLRSELSNIMKRLAYILPLASEKVDLRDILDTFKEQPFIRVFCHQRDVPAYGDSLLIYVCCAIEIAKYEPGDQHWLNEITDLCTGSFRTVGTSAPNACRLQWRSFKAMELIARRHDILKTKFPELVPLESVFCVMTDWIATSIDTPALRDDDSSYFYTKESLKIFVNLYADIGGDNCCWTLPMRYKMSPVGTRDFNEEIELLMRHLIKHRPKTYWHMLALVILNLHYFDTEFKKLEMAKLAIEAHVAFFINSLGSKESRTLRLATFFEVLGVIDAILFLSNDNATDLNRLLPLDSALYLIDGTGLSLEEEKITSKFIYKYTKYNLSIQELHSLNKFNAMLDDNCELLRKCFQNLDMLNAFNDPLITICHPVFIEIEKIEQLNEVLKKPNYKEVKFYIIKLFEAFKMNLINDMK